MKLTQENIQFIDAYLENSDVVHIDIRMEMVDHVATAIETKMNNGDNREFYYIFKDYMVENKKELSNRNKKIIQSTDKKLVKLILKELATPKSILIFASLFLSLKFFIVNNNILEYNSWFTLLPFISLLIFGVGFYIYLRYNKLQRFSSIERLGVIFSFILQIAIFTGNFGNLKKFESNENILFFLYSLTIVLLLSFVFVGKRLVKLFNVKYASINL